MPKDEAFNKLSDEELINAFIEIFYHELESWFSADIACCDECYDDFVSKWPAVYFRDLDFQRSCIDINCFYSGSRLQDFFSLEESHNLFRNIHCPRCNSSIRNCIWPYNFKFDLPDDFESELCEISRLSEKTPFLRLNTKNVT